MPIPSRPSLHKPFAVAAVAAVFVVAPALADEVVRQDVSRGDALEVTDGSGPARVIQSGTAKPYRADYVGVGLVFNTGKETTTRTQLKPANSVATTMLGVRGKETHVRFAGNWEGDASGGHPILVLTEGGRITIEPEAQIDLVMDLNFFTRQLWVHGDGTGTIELAEGFIADRTQNATVANAMGTIRLGGADLITHHSQSLPYNSRPDGRGGVYHNGHIVFEQKPGSTWHIQTNPQVYAAQIDFDVDGTINSQQPITHTGQRRVCLPVGNGGAFVSTGAFRTTSPDVAITKAGQAMLSLEGQQSYLPGSSLHIKQGLLRIHTDPGAGQRVAKEAGPFLHIEVYDGGRLHFAAATSHLKSIRLHHGAHMSVEDDVVVHLTDGLTVDAGATLAGESGVKGTIHRPQ